MGAVAAATAVLPGVVKQTAARVPCSLAQAHTRWWLHAERTRSAVLQDHARLILLSAFLPCSSPTGALHVADQKTNWHGSGARIFPLHPQLAPWFVAGFAHFGPPQLFAPFGFGRGCGLGSFAAEPGAKSPGRHGRSPSWAQARSKSNAPSAPTARWVARSMRWWKTVSGCAKKPVFDSPINLGAHCAKGAALREHGHGEYRLRYPMKLVNGKYERISWDTALDRNQRQDVGAAQSQRSQTAFTSWVLPSTTTSKPICCASL